ncbi:hypothetical protein [Marinobacter sp.]|uniref:hypothetical protein n=1 Tax=Marinobacter sp. TaxID=50741 RepID=UPI00356A73EB
MTTPLSERSWLLDRGNLKLVRQCCRLIESEFGVRLHLTEEHLEQKIEGYVRKSLNLLLPYTWKSLLAQVPELAELEQKPEEPPKRMYRGQEIVEDRREGEGVQASQQGHLPRKKQVIYRGQVIG